MELTKFELEHFQSLNNQVLIKITRRTDEIEYGSLKIYYDNSFDNYRNAVVTGEVLSAPKSLDERQLLYTTEMELQKGDIVWFHYLAYVNAMPGPNQDVTKYYEIEGEEWYCILVDYKSIFVAKRQDQIMPLNGHVIISPLDAEDIWESDVLVKPDITFKKYKYSETFGIVNYVGKPIPKYFKDMYFPDDPNVSEGDIVVIDTACDIPFEVDLHRTFEKEVKEPYYRVQRKDILGVVSHVD